MSDHDPDSALTAPFAQPAGADDPDWASWRSIALADFRPGPQVVTATTRVERAAYPVIDVHNHLGRWLTADGTWMTRDVGALLTLMDECGVERIVNLDGRWGEDLSANVARYDRAHPGRFVTFCHLDWTVLQTNPHDAAAALVAQLDDAHQRGARGVKVWKDLGLSVRDATGRLVMPDDERVVTALAHAGALGLPVLIHTADPVAFFQPIDHTNERLEELSEVPEWWFGDRSRYPTFDALMAALKGLVAAAPATTFIGAHVGGYAENLAWVGRMMTDHPNFHVDIGGRLAEIGRSPRAFARLVAEHPDRVLFGSDCFPPDAAAYRALYRFLETIDEHWPYAGDWADQPPQGRWAVSGAGLDSVALQGIYRENAIRLGL